MRQIKSQLRRCPDFSITDTAVLAQRVRGVYSPLSMAQERPPPKSYLEPGQLWIYDDERGLDPGRLQPDAPAEVHLVQAISLRLHLEFSEEEDRKWSLRDIAEECKISHRAVYDLWNGETWPNVKTIARIELGMGRTIWGEEHRRPNKREPPRRE